MPRQPRLKGENLTYHIVQRGNGRKNIFVDDEDKRRYLYTLKKKTEKDHFQVYAYCLMDNHVHILAKVSDSDISEIMKKVNVSYVMYFNKKHKKYGHLFQNRFLSEIVNTNRYLLQASKYIHRNPVKACMVDNPEDYIWSSYRIYIGIEKDRFDIMNTDTILETISFNKKDAINRYKEFVGYEDIMDNEHNKFMDMESKDERKKFDNELANKIINEKALSKEQLVIDIRNRTKLTTREIGKKLNISAATVSRILNIN